MQVIRNVILKSDMWSLQRLHSGNQRICNSGNIFYVLNPLAISYKRSVLVTCSSFLIG